MTESVTGNDVIVSKDAKGPDNGTAAAAVKPPINADEKKKKKRKRGAFGFFTAALFMLRKRPGGKAAEKILTEQKSAESNANWKKLVGSMRPLSLEETTMPPSPRPPQKQAPAVKSTEDIVFPPASPTASSSCGTMSQYASATNLHDLDNGSDDEEDPDEVFDALCGDEMIDAKAEEFIAQFYRQIQIQNTSATDRHA